MLGTGFVVSCMPLNIFV